MKFVITFLFALFLLSCQDLENMDRPKDLIAKQKMVEVLTDLSLLNSAKNYNKKFLEESGLKPDEYLYQKYDIDSVQLAHSTRYYARNYTEFEEIYRQVQENLQKIKDDLEKRQERERESLDSLRRTGKDSLRLNPSLRRTRTLDSLTTSPFEAEKEIL